MVAMQLLGWKFRPALVPSLAALAALIVTASLGRWQLERADEKLALQRQFEASRDRLSTNLNALAPGQIPARYTRVRAEGQFEPRHEVLVDNQMARAIAGYHVYTPFRLSTSHELLLVNRGFVARTRRYPELPSTTVPAGQLRIEGYVMLPPERFVELSPQTMQGKLWQNITPTRFREQTGLNVLPFYLYQQSDTGDALRRVHVEPDFKVATHNGYAVQWFALAALVVALYLGLNVKRVG